MHNLRQYAEHQDFYYSPSEMQFSKQETPVRQANLHYGQEKDSNAKLHDLKNFIGVIFEELKYSCDVLKDEVFRDREHMLHNFQEANFSLKELGDKIQEQKGGSSARNDLNKLLEENSILKRQNNKLHETVAEGASKHRQEIEKIRHQSYLAFQQNFVLNQKITSLETQLSNQATDVIDELNREHKSSILILNHHIEGLEETLRERDETISILQRLVKDYEQEEKRTNRLVQQDEHSKVLNMLSMESYDSKRRIPPLRQGSDSFNNSQVGDRYQSEKQKSRSQLNIGAEQYKYESSPYQMPSPIGTAQKQYSSQFPSYSYHSNNIYSGVPNKPLRSPQNIPKYNTETSYHDKFQKPENQVYGLQYQSNTYMPPKPPRQTSARVSSRNEYSSFYSSNKIDGHRQVSVKSRDEDKRSSRGDHRKDNKVDLSKIEQELEGLSRQLKTELATISRKK